MRWWRDNGWRWRWDTGAKLHSHLQPAPYTDDPARQSLQVDRQREVSVGRALNTNTPESLRGTAPAVPGKTTNKYEWGTAPPT